MLLQRCGRMLTLLVSLNLLLGLNTRAQENNCEFFKEGEFHFYEKQTGQHITIKNKKNSSKQFFDSGDSTSWRIKWLSGCRFTMQYLTGSIPLSKKDEKLLYNHFIAYEINTVTEDFFTYTSFRDDFSGKVLTKDTMWRDARTDVSLPAATEYVTLDKKIEPDSSFALVYVYRPYKLVGFAVSYRIYFGEHLVGFLKNNSGYGFKVSKEGDLVVRGNIYNGNTEVTINVKKGNTYYIHTELKTGLVKGKVGMDVRSEAEAQKELKKIRED